ncbi:acyloxyacyl hydrolase [Hyphococcus formosus]|uniref:acyloxyacyl hydrolase n=1 Tax=Hyphococcus formosus TaxID=3143534 RepID=UPI00398B5A9B
MRIISAIAAFLSVFGIASASYAIVPVDEVRAGVYAQSCCGIGSSKEQGVAINAEAVFESPRVLSVLGSPRPVIGATVATDSDATSQIYTGLDWQVNVSRWFLSAGAGVAVHNGETDRYDPVADINRVDHTVFFGCRALFRLAGDVGYRLTDTISASFHFNHISNAGLCNENEGLDQMGLRLGFRL